MKRIEGPATWRISGPGGTIAPAETVVDVNIVGTVKVMEAAVAAGADGLIIEVHPDPECALSDGYQSLNFAQFSETVEQCRKVAESVDKKI